MKVPVPSNLHIFTFFADLKKIHFRYKSGLCLFSFQNLDSRSYKKIPWVIRSLCLEKTDGSGTLKLILIAKDDDAQFLSLKSCCLKITSHKMYKSIIFLRRQLFALCVNGTGMYFYFFIFEINARRNNMVVYWFVCLPYLKAYASRCRAWQVMWYLSKATNYYHMLVDF